MTRQIYFRTSKEVYDIALSYLEAWNKRNEVLSKLICLVLDKAPTRWKFDNVIDLLPSEFEVLTVLTNVLMNTLIYVVICHKKKANCSVPIPALRNGLKWVCIWKQIMCHMATWGRLLNFYCACLAVMHPLGECFSIWITSGLKSQFHVDFMNDKFLNVRL
jgi:hypothetical protein